MPSRKSSSDNGLSDEEVEATIRRYLSLLDIHPSRRGRKRSVDGVRRRIAELRESPPATDPIVRLEQIQERMDLEAELERLSAAEDLRALEDDFVAVLGGYAQKKGITYDALKEIGVATVVLRRAGLRGSASA
jgi:hypothetical protein